MNRKHKKALARIIASGCLLAALTLFPPAGWAKPALYLATYLLIGYDILIKAFKGLIHGSVFDENFLMAVATLGAFALVLIKRSNDGAEAIAVMLFYQVGELFQSYAVDKSRRSIAELMDIRPDYANIESEGGLIRVDPYDVAVDTEIVVQPGEKVPIDGVVTQGESALNTAALTGESAPRICREGDEILSGSINLSGVIKLRTTKEFGESTAAKILELVEYAGARKARSEEFITKFARVYTPAVCISALLLALVPPGVRLMMGKSAEAGEWIYRALTFLVISCPCALVLSIPLSFFAGIGGAGRAGVLIKGGNYLEALAQSSTIVLDKTGTLTKGSFEVSAVHHSPLTDAQLIETAALAECASSHPISKSLLRAYGRPIERSRVTDINEKSGYGVTARVDGAAVAVGSARLMEHLGIKYTPCGSAGTVVHVAINGVYQGHILIEDELKPGSKAAIEQLKRAGMRVVMLTGDARAVSERVAANTGIDEAVYELLPDGKVSELERIISERSKYGKVAFVGDGINDAPVLARADVGIAMGALGSDAAVEAADVVIMDDDPLKISRAIRIARKCVRIAQQNIVFALAIKLSFLILGALGIANMWYAVFADVGVMVLAVLNAIRALNLRGV